MQWVRAQSIAEALSHAGPTSRYVGGGLSLSLLLQRGIEQPETLIDLSALPLRQIEGRQGLLRIGSQVRLAELSAHPMVQSLAPLLTDIVRQLATPALRNQATVGGELLERTRCPLFRDPSNPRCNKRTVGSGCAVIDGSEHPGALFGTSASCVAASASELAIGLCAMSAEVTLYSPEGTTERSLPLLALYRSPGSDPSTELTIERTELLTSVTVPVATQQVFGYARLAESPLVPLASCAVMLSVRDQVVVDAKVILGGLTAKPWRAERCEPLLIGQPLASVLSDRVVNAALDGAQPRPASRPLRSLAQQVVREALRRAVEKHAAHRR